MNVTNAGGASPDHDLQKKLASFLRPTFDSRLQKHLGDGMLLEGAVLNTIDEVKTGLRSRIESLRESKPDQAASLERLSETVLASMAVERLLTEAGSTGKIQPEVSVSSTMEALNQSAYDPNPVLSGTGDDGSGGHEAINVVEPESVADTRQARTFPMVLAFVAGTVLGAGGLFAAYTSGMKEMPAAVRTGTIIVPPDRLATMQTALDDWTVALKKVQALFETKDFGASVPDDRWRPLQSVHRDVFDAIRVSSRAGSSMILRRGKEGGYKILVQGPLCNLALSQAPQLVDPVRNKPVVDFCWNFGFWDEAGQKF